MEEHIDFISGEHRIEGLLEKGALDKGVVITHPHPLYGGDMYNTVVEAIVGTYRGKGFSTLRFNFRGVGKSQGQFEDGMGEQKDVVAARSYLKEMGFKRIDLAGYSFGAWINAIVGCPDSSGQDMVMVSPPVAFVDFSPVTVLPCLKLVVTGSRDDIAPADRIKEMLPKWNTEARFKRIDGADHFYGGNLDQLESILSMSL